MSTVAVQSLSHAGLYSAPWTVACQAPLSSDISQSLIKFMSIESVMLFNHLILHLPLFFWPLIFPSIRVFSNKLALYIRWSKSCSFSFSINPSNECSTLGLTSLILQSKELSRAFSSTTIGEQRFFAAQASSWPTSLIHAWLLEKPHRREWPSNIPWCICTASLSILLLIDI